MLQKKVSVIIVSYNVQYFLELCLHSVIRSLRNIDSEIIVVDNNSADDSCRLVSEQFEDVILIANKTNTGFSKANNQGLEISQGQYIHFLNPDTVVGEDFYQKTIAYLDTHADVGCIGPRLIDGRGLYAVDSKKSFPSFWTSVYKLCGLSKLFPKSPVFNKYYVAQVKEYETAPVDILSGCCLLARKSAMIEAGGGLDESYFMYCEDVDLCHRIGLKGYKNIYFPEVSVIHYKGESTRKLSYRYMKIFYEAHAHFVKKYYPKNLGIAYISALRTVLALRNLLNWTKHLLSVFKMFILDALLLTLVTVAIKNFWFDTIAQFKPENNGVFFKTIPIFVLTWMLSLFFSGAYDKPFSLFKAGRGMVLGTIVVLAGYGLMPFEYRYSRGIVLFSGMTGTMVLLMIRWLLSLMHWIKLVPRGKLDYKAAIIGSEPAYEESRLLLQRNLYNLEVLGRISETPSFEKEDLGSVTNLADIQKLYRINELIFNAGSVDYSVIMQQMEQCAPNAFYKIHVRGSDAFVGSNNSRHHAEEFALDKRYNIGAASSKRNKRLVDILIAGLLFISFPFAAIKVEHKSNFFRNILRVIAGKKTWVGYQDKASELAHLPVLKPAVLPPYIITNYKIDETNKARLAEQYAQNYGVLDDLRLLWVNFKYLGNNQPG
jgi:GT2 family glycosyltransferase